MVRRHFGSIRRLAPPVLPDELRRRITDDAGRSTKAIAAALNAEGDYTEMGGARWYTPTAPVLRSGDLDDILAAARAASIVNPQH
jgi:hypothetical protein